MDWKSYLSNRIRTDAVTHAYLFEGVASSAASETALWFAGELLGKPSPDPDLIVLTHEKENVIRVDEVREGVIEKLALRPYRGGRKVVVIPDAELMNEAAQNALLKTIEEPPSYAVICLIASNSATLLPTITSRCETLSFEAEGDLIPGEESEQFAELPYLSYEEIREIAKSPDGKKKAEDLLDRLQCWIRDILFVKAEFPGEQLMYAGEIDALIEQADLYTAEELNRFSLAVEEARKKIASNVNQEATLELLLLRFQEKTAWQE